MPVDDVVVAAREVASVESLDLDDAGTEIGQVPGGQRGGDGLLDGDDRDALQREHHDAFFAARTRPPPMMRRWISLVPS